VLFHDHQQGIERMRIVHARRVLMLRTSIFMLLTMLLEL
jgi:hypothetical protein